MGWLHKLLRGDADGESPPVAAAPNPGHLVPPPMPKLGAHDPAGEHRRTYASKSCPSCDTRVKDLTGETTICDNCGKPVVVKSGEDGQWHLLREADVKDFEDRQEQIRTERYKADEDALLEAGFLTGDVQVDVVDEADYQEALKRLAGDRSRTGSIEPVVALLSREPGHPHDKDAIRIDVGDATVGYVLGRGANQIQPLLQRMEQAGRPAWVRGWVVGGWDDDHSDNNYRFRLDGLPAVD
jgi:uncharacterized Zn finger protein (UPF0148 family)